MWACKPRGEYPVNWEAVATKAKERANWTCEHCGMGFDTSGKSLTAVNADGKPVILTVHHLNGDKGNCAWVNLLVCCQACHLHIQALWAPGLELPAEWLEVPRWLLERNLDYRLSRQLRMF